MEDEEIEAILENLEIKVKEIIEFIQEIKENDI